MPKPRAASPIRAPRKLGAAPRSSEDRATARQVLAAESHAIAQVSERLDSGFSLAVDAVVRCRGRIVVTGMGKAGFLAQRLSALFASVGMPSLYLHPADAAHGDLGRVGTGDVLVALSNSGSGDELVRLLPSLKALRVTLIAITGKASSPLGRAAQHVLAIGSHDEACPLGLVPTASSAALHAMGDALAMGASRRRPISRQDYARLHPGGALGRALVRVEAVMRTGAAIPHVSHAQPLSKAIAVMTQTPGRPGCALVCDARGKLLGIFTDGDLRRLIEQGALDLNQPVGQVMSANPVTVQPSDLAVDATELLRARHVDQVAAVDARGKLVGLLDVQDLLAARFLE